jgi:hypothetical protein
MLKKIIGLLGAAAVFGVPQMAQAAPSAPTTHEALKVESYGDLLASIPDATRVLASVDEAAAQNPLPPQKVAWHHHHHHWRRHRHHHHHHHHHHHYL